MIKIHEFWVEMFPMFVGQAEFVYLFLDAVTVVSFFRIVTMIPQLLLTGRPRGGGRNW